MIIPKQTFSIYGIMIVSAVFIGLFYILVSLRKEIKNNKLILLYVFLYMVFAVVFGIKVSIYQNAENHYAVRPGLYSYGGVIGVILSAVIFERIIPTNGKLLKSATISLPLTYAIGKIGCLRAGCCYGIPYTGFLSVTYIDKMQFSVFPVQLTETIAFLAIFVLCNALRYNKNIVYITAIISAVTKFALDYLRYEHIGKILTTNQVLSIFLVAITVAVYVINKAKEKNNDL